MFATGGIGGVHRGALVGLRQRPGRRSDPRHARHLVGPRGARSDAGGGRVRRAEGDPRPAADPRVPRDPRRPGGRARPGRGARVLRPVERASRRRCRSPTRRAAASSSRPISVSGSDRGSSSACRCRPRPPCPEARPPRGRDRAVAEAAASGIHGPALTPWLLARIAELTDGASLRANVALIENDARVAGRLAVALAG